MKSIKIFNYTESLNCFVVNPEYKKISDRIGLTECNEVVWIGRYFSLDNDYGEHWFDNWKERDEIEEKAKKSGIKYDDILIISPERHKNGVDGPCHSDSERKQFWTDVLKCLELNIETIFNESRKLNNEREESDEDYIKDLENIISEIKIAFR
jgi:hypothetical protein